MRIAFRVLFVAYLLFLVACAWIFLDKSDAGGPYHLGRAIGSIAAGLPWTLVAFVIYPPNAGPVLLYVISVVGALVNLALLAHFAGWLRLWDRSGRRHTAPR
jgi:hypothetical protein